MQIIIVQAEIETAIRNHIHSLLNVKDGNSIEIALSATRGEDGFKAIIDIVPAGTAAVATAAAAPAPVEAPKKDTKAEVAVTKSTASVAVVQPKEAPKAEPVSQGNEQAAQEQPPVDGMTETSATTNTETAGPGSEAAASAEPSSTEPAAENKPRSLFAGLRKPVNVAS